MNRKSRYFKYTLLCIVIIMSVVALTGCYSMYPLKINYKGTNIDGKSIDLLVPIKNDDEVENESWDIEKYSVGGYKSIIHSNHIQDVATEANDLELYFNSHVAFKKFCEQYKTFKIAVVDENNNIVHISEEYELLPFKQVYLDDITYDFDTNTPELNYDYKRSLSLILAEFLASSLMSIFSLYSLILFVSFVWINRSKKIRNEIPNYLYYIFYNLGAFVTCLPLLCYLLIRLDYARKTLSPPINALYDIWELNDGFLSVFYFLPVALCIAVFVWTMISITHSGGKPNVVEEAASGEATENIKAIEMAENEEKSESET